MRPISRRWRDALTHSHKSHSRIELWYSTSQAGVWFDAGQAPPFATFITNLQVVEGTLRHDLASFVTGTLSATIAIGYSGEADADYNQQDWKLDLQHSWLSPIHRITYDDGFSEEIRMGTYRVTRIRPGHIAGQIEIEAEDGLTNLTAVPITSRDVSIYNFQADLNNQLESMRADLAKLRAADIPAELTTFRRPCPGPGPSHNIDSVDVRAACDLR